MQSPKQTKKNAKA